MKKIVVSGSGKCREKIDELIKRLSAFYDVLNYPKDISKEKFLELYPHIHKEFYENIVKTDVFLLFNYDKDETAGYIGAAGFAEMCFAISQNQLSNKNIEIFIYKMPDKKVQCYDEINLYLQLGWIKLWNKSKQEEQNGQNCIGNK